VIWGDDRSKFDEPETKLKGKRVCATGRIQDYKGKPQIVLRDAAQLVAR